MRKMRTKTKAGFTLLEVLLAVVILVFASTMIMKGFVAVMAFGRNDRNYAKSGEENYRRALNETLIRYATAGNQQTGVMNALAGTPAARLDASFTDGSHTPSGVTDSSMDLIVDVSAFTDSTVSFTQTVGGDSLDASTSAVNRYAFFYDFSDYIGPNTEGHIYRYGYMYISTAAYNALDAVTKAKYRPVYGSDGVTIQGYGLYGFYCFNSTHVHMSGGVSVPDNCRNTPHTPAPVC